MDISDIIKSVQNKNEEIETAFYKECINVLENLKNKKIYRIEENKYILESVRIHVTANLEKYNIFVGGDEPTSTMIFRKLSISEKGKNNLLKQINALENNSVNDICLSNKFQFDYLYCIISEKKSDLSDKYVKLKNKRDSLKLLLGIETLSFLEHQDLDRFCNYLKSNDPKIKRSTTMFNDFYHFYKELDEDTQYRMMIFSGYVLHSLGTTYTADTDIIYYGEGESVDKIRQIKEMLDKNSDYEYSIIYDKSVIQREESRSYVYLWMSYLWPNIIGVSSIKEVLVDPEYHLYFFGIKMINVQMTIERLILRASPSSFVDLIMLDEINGYKSEPCFPNVCVRQGKVLVCTDEYIRQKLLTIQKYFKEWHGLDRSLDELSLKIKRCAELPHHIYKKEPERNEYTTGIGRYHNTVMRHYIGKYLRTDKLLDIGAGPLRNLSFYNNIGIKKLIAIEPSAESIAEGLEKYNEMNPTIHVKMIEGYGDEIWRNNPNYNAVEINKPYQSILFKFTIHYMIKNLENVLRNIQDVQNDNTTIIISCLDGNRVEQKLNKYRGKYEVFIGDEPIYGVYNFEEKTDDLKKILIYFKGIYGVEQGSIEYLVDVQNLIKKFESIGYKVILNKFFTEVDDPGLVKIKNRLNYQQKLVSELHKIIVLRRDVSEKTMKGGNMDDEYYYQKYIKYKNKYLRYRY